MTYGRLGQWFVCGLVVLAAACGGSKPVSDTEQSAPAEPTFLAGIHATDVSKVMRVRGLACGEPVEEQGFKHWSCEVRTPLLTYSVDYYGRVPGRLEYIRTVVSQSGAPKVDLITPVVFDIAALRITNVDRAAAKTWVEQHIQIGGQTRLGPAKFKISGDLARLVFEVKAPGSEW
jgi:hypothetical protein